VHERRVRALEGALPHELHQPLVCVLRPRDGQQPRGVAVEPVHDPGPLGIAARAAAGQRIDERVAAVPRAGVDDQPGRLVDDQDVLVLPDDVRRGRRDNRSRCLLLRQLDLLAACEAEALRPRASVDERAPGDGALCRRPRAEQAREEAVEALAGGVRRDVQAHRAATSSGRRPGGFGARSAANSASSSMITPIQMKLSARLNAGQ